MKGRMFVVNSDKIQTTLNTQIASIAIANNLILVTKNTKDFQIFKDKCNLMLEDWN